MSMNTEIFVFLAYGVGFFIIFFFGRLLFLPARLLLRLLVNSLLGAGMIALINIVGSIFSFGIPLNIFNALFIGALGIPGAVTLVFLFTLGI